MTMGAWHFLRQGARHLVLSGAVGLLGLVGPGVLPGLAAHAHAAPAESGARWESLTPAQQQALAPLRQDWSSIDAQRKQKWIELASRFGQMPVAERTLIQQRMAEWARLPAGERTRVRQQFQEVRQISPDERQARWQEYQALPPERRQQLAEQAQQRKTERSTPPAAETPRTAAQAKANVLPLKSATPAQVVAPSVLQGLPGATTTTVAARQKEAPFQQAGLPKIAATPEFVDPATLLPRRGAQAAARIDPPASAPRTSAQ